MARTENKNTIVVVRKSKFMAVNLPGMTLEITARKRRKTKESGGGYINFVEVN